MIRGYKFLTLILLSFFLSLLFFLITPAASYAAGLNASEQELVAKAKGTFEWNGKKYRAKQTYLDQLTAYLSRDDVDLSADTCAAAAKEMYGSVERGVMEGYLYEVDSNSSGKQSDGDPLTASETASQEEKSAEQESPSEKVLPSCSRCRAALCRIRAGTTNTKQISDRPGKPASLSRARG